MQPTARPFSTSCRMISRVALPARRRHAQRVFRFLLRRMLADRRFLHHDGGAERAMAVGQVASQTNSALASGYALSSNRHARAGRQPEAYVAVRAEGRSHEARAEW